MPAIPPRNVPRPYQPSRAAAPPVYRPAPSTARAMPFPPAAVQPKAMPPRMVIQRARIVIPPPFWRPGVVQRMRGVDLESASSKALEYVTVSAATEVQAMHVDGSVAMTANNPTAMAALSKEQQADLVKTLSPSHATPLGTVKTADSYDACATKLQTKDRSLIILNAASGEYHAEQRLLLVLAKMLKNSSVPSTIHVWGAKPPCGACKAVLKAFNKALDIVYEKVILFSGQAGQDRARAQISADPVFNVAEGDTSKFAEFARFFKNEMARD